MNVFIAAGTDILESLNTDNKPQKNEQEKIDFKKLYINLKDGESSNIRFLSNDDVKMYKSHGNFNLKLYNQTCTMKSSGRCAYCEAHRYAKENDVDGWKDIYGKNRYLFAMYDLDQKETRIFSASKGQAKILFSTITEYKEDLHMPFKLSRSGEKVETTYTLSPIIRVKNEDHKRALEASNGLTVPSELFDNALIIRSYNGQVKHLKELGFPNPEIFNVEEENKSQFGIHTEGHPDQEIKEIKDDDLPF
jgi:hypothetical protein